MLDVHPNRRIPDINACLSNDVFDFNWTGSWTVPVFGSLAGAALALAAGWWGLRAVLKTPVVETLRKSQ